jgi:hypothetical protein
MAGRAGVGPYIRDNREARAVGAALSERPPLRGERF